MSPLRSCRVALIAVAALVAPVSVEAQDAKSEAMAVVKRLFDGIGDVLVDLDEAVREKTEKGSGFERFAWLMVATGILLVVVSAMFLRSRSVGEETRSTARARLSLLLPPGMDFPERENQVAVSPDGTMIAYVAAAAGQAPRVVLKRLDAESEQIVPDAIDVRDPFFSPDGRWIGFISGDTIRKVSIAGGQSRVVCQAPRPVTASWANGVILFGEGGDHPEAGIRRVAEDGGPVEIVTTLNREAGERNHSAAQLLPDGRTVIYTVRAIEAAGTVNRVMVQSPGAPARVLVDNARFGRYMGDSVLIYQRGPSLFTTTLNLDALTTSGPGVMLFNDVAPGEPVWSSAGGVLVYRSQNTNRRFVWVSRSGAEVTVAAPPRRYGSPSLSPAGDRVAAEIDNDGKFDIWMLDLERQALTNLTSDGSSRYPMWAPNGTDVGLARRLDNSVFVLPAGGGESHELVRSKEGSWIGSWTPDMRTLVYMLEDPVTRTDLWEIDLQTKDAPRPLIRTAAREYGGRLSHDGRWLAYFSDENSPGQFELFVTTLARGGPRHRVAPAGAREAVWSKNATELFYRNGRQIWSVRASGIGDFSRPQAEVMFEGNYFTTGGPGIVNYDVSPDGERFLMLKFIDADRPPHLTVVQGLDRLIRERLPPGAR